MKGDKEWCIFARGDDLLDNLAGELSAQIAEISGIVKELKD